MTVSLHALHDAALQRGFFNTYVDTTPAPKHCWSERLNCYIQQNSKYQMRTHTCSHSPSATYTLITNETGCGAGNVNSQSCVKVDGSKGSETSTAINGNNAGAVSNCDGVLPRQRNCTHVSYACQYLPDRAGHVLSNYSTFTHATRIVSWTSRTFVV